MRNGQKRMRGRNHRKSQNPLTRVYESNGPDVKIRGTANHIAEKYIQLARDAQGSGDPVAAENYYQHAEHYFRLIAAAQEQFRQQNPYFNQQQPGGNFQQGNDDGFDGDDDDGMEHAGGGSNEPFAPREQPQPFLPRDAQPFPQRDGQPHQQGNGGRQNFHQQPQGGQPRQQEARQQDGRQQDVGGLPSFITGGAAPQQPGPGDQTPSYGQNGNSNGYEQGERGQDRFGGRHRRRRHRGPRPDMAGQQSGMPRDNNDEPTQAGE